MGNRGKVEERARARELRAESWTLQEIADELGVAKGTVSVWVRDVDFEPRPRNRGHPAGRQHPMRLKREAEIERCRVEAEDWVGDMSERDLAMFCLGLYAGEGSKTDGAVSMANTNPRYLRALLAWLRGEFELDDARWRARLYLHEGLDLEAAMEHWTELLGIEGDRFHKPYRAVADSSIRSRKHVHGCATVVYSDSSLHRRVMARIEAITSRFDLPG
jgi:transcriptional regulator with XRE-family HTH domain